jgi:hypothetical protein
MKPRNQDSRFLKLSTKAMTGEAAPLESRRDEGGPFPVEAETRKSRVDGAGAGAGAGAIARSGVMRRYLLTLRRSKRGMRAEQRGDSHPREAARLVACQ